MKQYRIALYPGDGIGQDVTLAARRVLEQTQEKFGTFSLSFEVFPWGCDYYDDHGVVAPDDFLEKLRLFDAIYLGALGFPSRLPDHITLQPIIRIRQAFDLYACVRPAKIHAGVRSPLSDPGDIDMVVVRENSEGEYVSMGGNFKVDNPHEVAIQTAVHTRHGVERILRFSFQLAQTRHQKLTMITKSNAQRFGFVLWDRVLEKLRDNYPDVTTNQLHIDAATLQFVNNPDSLDVVVASNLFGDILTDLSGAITGSLGLNPSANLNPEREHPSLFEPVHGSAPDISGRGIANPVAAILSAAMMLDWLGAQEAAVAVERAVSSTLAAECGTPDIGGNLNTEEMTECIVERIKV